MPRAGETITGPDGQLRVWVPDSTNSQRWEYQQEASGFQSAEDALQADLDTGQGSYVPASFVEKMPMAMKIFIATGLVSMGITGGAALASALTSGGVTAGGTAAATGGAGGTAGGGGAAAATSGTLGTNAMAGTTMAPWLGGGGTAAAGGGGAAVGGTAGGAGTIGTLAKLGTVGQTLMGGAQGAATGREREALINQQRDELRQRQAEQERQAALDKGKLELDQRVTGQDMETQARRQAAWGQFMQKPGNPFTVPDYVKARIGGTPDYSGYSSIGSDAYRDAQQRLLTGADKKFTEQPNVPTPPLTPLQDESTWEKIQRLAGMGMGLAGSFSNYRAPTGRT